MQKIPRKLGEILIEAGIVSEQQLLSALAIQKEKKRPLGEILIENEFVSREKLEAVLAKQYGSILGEILIDRKLINFQQFQDALRVQGQNMKTLGEILIESGNITEENLIDARSKQYNIPKVDLSSYSINPEAVSKVPMDVLRHYVVLPIDIKDNTLVVVCSDPGDVLATQDLRFISGMDVNFVLAPSNVISTYLE